MNPMLLSMPVKCASTEISTKSQGPRHLPRERHGIEHLRARGGSPWTSGWRIRGDVSARRLPCRPLILRRQGLEDSPAHLLPGAFSRMGPYAQLPGPRTSLERPT